MNRFFEHLSVKRKLFAISIGSSIFAMLLALVILIAINIADVKHKAQTELTTLATLIANRSIAGIMFDDAALIKENLVSLSNVEMLKSACVFNKSGHLIAEFNKARHSCPNTNVQLSEQSNSPFSLHIFRPMVNDEETVGSVYLTSNLNSSVLQQLQYIAVIVAVLCMALFVTFLMSMPLLNRVANPIAELAMTAQNIDRARDYSLRAEPHSNDDEIGILVKAFNDMLETVEIQNRTLTAVKDNYQTLYDHNPTMVFDLDQTGQICSVNWYGAKQLSRSIKDIEGCSLFSLIHPEDVDEARAFFERCLVAHQRIHKLESRMVCANGNIIWIRQTARLIRNEHNQPRLLLVCEDITETHLLSEKIAYQASHDELTGLVNRRQFDSYLQNLVAQSQVDHSTHSLCYLDLDQFKIVNDTGGHMAGDELLRQLSEVLKQQIRKTDILARLGGDEFGILMTHCDIDQATLTAEKLRLAVQDFQFAWGNRSFTVGVSIGIAHINQTCGNAVDVLKEADSACYAAKEKGRNRVHVFKADDRDLAIRQGEMQWVEKIRSGIEHNRFQLYGQEVIRIGGEEQGLHFETLLRYIDDNGNLIQPGAFLPAAERYNIAPTLDRWVIANVLKYICETPNFIQRLHVCAINLSGLSLTDETMLNFIDEQFKKWRVPTHKICFEITETAAIGNLSYAKQFIDTLRQQGCLFSLDDFGSGLSSFAYLKNLPVDFLKIDGLFVKDILIDEVDWAMVKAINEVGHVMNKKTIAEFVENAEVLELLKELGVDYAQGFGIAIPRPLNQL